jgi:hypothetical protein
MGTTNRTEMTIKQFRQLAKEWSLSDAFYFGLESAIKREKISFRITTLSDIEKRFLDNVGLEYVRDKNTYLITL